MTGIENWSIILPEPNFPMKTTKLIRTLLLAALAFTIVASSAQADDRRNHKRDRHHNGNGINIDLVVPGVSVDFYPRQERTVIIERNRRYYDGNSIELDVQRALARRGYYRGAIDGDVGYGTRLAIRNYQLDYGLVPTAHINSELLIYLNLR